jgi:hypothetical protein
VHATGIDPVLSFAAMANVTAKIRFKATLLRPASPKGAAWTFLVLPKTASAKRNNGVRFTSASVRPNP